VYFHLRVGRRYIHFYLDFFFNDVSNPFHGDYISLIHLIEKFGTPSDDSSSVFNLPTSSVLVQRKSASSVQTMKQFLQRNNARANFWKNFDRIPLVQSDGFGRAVLSWGHQLLSILMSSSHSNWGTLLEQSHFWNHFGEKFLLSTLIDNVRLLRTRERQSPQTTTTLVEEKFQKAEFPFVEATNIDRRRKLREFFDSQLDFIRDHHLPSHQKQKLLRQWQRMKLKHVFGQPHRQQQHVEGTPSQPHDRTVFTTL